MESLFGRHTVFNEDLKSLIINYYTGVDQVISAWSYELASLTDFESSYIKSIIDTVLEGGGGVGIVEWPVGNQPMQATLITKNSMQRAINYNNRFLPSEASSLPEEETYDIHIGISPKDFIVVFKSASFQLPFVFDNEPKGRQRRGAILYKEPDGKWKPLLGVNSVRNQMNWVLFDEAYQLSFTQS